MNSDSISDYLTETEIKNAIFTIRKYGFYLLSVDGLDNVYINPFYSSAPAYLLRLKISTGDSIVRMSFVYTLYKDNWYLKSSD